MDIENLSYYILGEVVTCLLSAVLCFNIFTTFSPYERKHRLFLYSGIASFFSTLFDILAVFCISYYKQVPIAVSTLVSTIFFVFLLSIPMLLSSYAFEMSCVYSHHQKKYYKISGVVYAAYLLIVLLNIKTGWIFRYDSELGYIRGPLKYLSYSLTAFYIIMTEISIISHKKSIAKRVFVVFMCYPFVSIIFLLIQFFNQKIILSGASSFAALLLAYVTIQSDMLEFDLVTGLMSEHKLQKHIELKKHNGILYVISIDNMNFIQNNMNSADLNQLLLSIGKEFQRVFECDSYHPSTNRFATICDTQDELENRAIEITKYIEEINAKKLFDIPTNLEVYYAALELSDNERFYPNIMEIINNLLNKAKINQTNDLQICDESVLVDMERKRYIFKILKRELNLDSTQFQVWFQPIYSIQEKKFTYMEALSRLNGTELGDIPPQEFVDVAERRGLIEQLGFVAFEKVCKFISENRGLVNAVSINFSVYQMTNPNVVEMVLDTIKKYDLKPDNIIMEITESIFIEDFEIVNRNMTELARAGVQFYLDDFGTGYSNLSNVVTLPFSTIKMDRTLVLMMEEGEKYVNLFSNLVDTFKGADLHILVEGVETQKQNELVQSAGVDNIQGFLYSRPLPPEKCIELIRQS